MHMCLLQSVLGVQWCELSHRLVWTELSGDQLTAAKKQLTSWLVVHFPPHVMKKTRKRHVRNCRKSLNQNENILKFFLTHLPLYENVIYYHHSKVNVLLFFFCGGCRPVSRKGRRRLTRPRHSSPSPWTLLWMRKRSLRRRLRQPPKTALLTV